MSENTFLGGSYGAKATRSQRETPQDLGIFNPISKYQWLLPVNQQIGDSINVKSTSLVDYYLNQLQEMGYIERENHISRSIRVVQPAQPGFR